ncbi:hypothetical protein KIW84_076465, partial [Lathyrus oleraceus]
RNLQRKSRSLKEFAGMPYPSGYVVEQLGNKLIYEERSYNPAEQLQEYNNLFLNLTDEQRGVFKRIMEAVNNQQGGVFFFVWIRWHRENLHVENSSFLHKIKETNLFNCCFIGHSFTTTSRRSNDSFNVQDSNTYNGVFYM